MDELQIVAGCKQQNREAQRLLYEKYARTMYAICLRYSSDKESAKDLLQDGFMKVFSRISSFQEKGSLEGWIKRVFINLALENIRKQKVVTHFADDIQNISDVSDISDEEEMYNISETELIHMIQELPPGYAAVFNMYAIENYSHKEIAQELGISESTSRSQYVRARQMLQKKVKQYLDKKDLR